MPKQPNPEQATERTTAYVYYSYEPWGRGYIGVRTAPGCAPGEAYLGSFRDTTFNPVNKIILFEGTKEECMAVEVKLHAFFDVARNPHFANRACQTSTLFSCAGRVSTPEQIENYRAAWTDERKRENAERLAERNRNPSPKLIRTNRRMRRAHWTRETWDTVESAVTVATGYHWGMSRLAKELGVSAKTLRRIRWFILAGVTYNDAVSGTGMASAPQ